VSPSVSPVTVETGTELYEETAAFGGALIQDNSRLAGCEAPVKPEVANESVT